MSGTTHNVAGPSRRVRITMLGRFSVAVDSVVVPEQAWSRRHASGVVKLLCLAPGRRVHREQLMDSFWPDTPVDPGQDYTRRLTTHAGPSATPGALVLRNDW
jgi:hypothetical protein